MQFSLRPLQKWSQAPFAVAVALLVLTVLFSDLGAVHYVSKTAGVATIVAAQSVLDRNDYDARILLLSHIPLSTSTSPTALLASTTGRLWPIRTAYPNDGAILPFHRIVAYYGNFYSKGMGVLGEYPREQMLSMLRTETRKWQEADPHTPVLPAIHYITVVAQGTAGREGNYILRMPDDQMDHALALARELKGILFLDVQVGKSTVEKEVPMLEKYLKLPDVHLALDPEFSMKKGDAPGRAIGTMDASDINYAAAYLAALTKKYGLPPKVLIVHRFTQGMITNYKMVRPLPEVQIVINMDGWGTKEKKKGTYNYIVAPEPIQFTGMKLFYKNDARPPSTGLLSTSEVLNLVPRPIYIQYQ